MKFSSIISIAIAATGLSAPGMVGAAGFDQFIGIGDSTLDSGYFRYHTTGNPAIDAALIPALAAGAKGGFAGPGQMVSTLLAERFGLNAAPIGGGGTNFANGGARTVAITPGNVPITQQITNYLASVNGTANPRGLYLVSTGNNDLLYVQSQSAAWYAANPGYLSDQASSLAASVASLLVAGARCIVVPNTFNSAVFAGPGGAISSDKALAYERSVAFTTHMWSSLTAAGVNFVPADLDSVFSYVATHPTQFGFTANSVLASSAPSPISALLTTPALLSPLQEKTYLFVDGKHLTTAGQRIEADYEYSLLSAPSQISLLIESASQGGFARTAALQEQLELSLQQRSHGLKAWFSAGAHTLRIKNAAGFPSASGTPFQTTAGLDYRTPAGALLGAALTAAYQNQRFSTGGHFKQKEAALSLYAALNKERFWAGAVAGFGLLQDRIAREVALGVFTDLNEAETRGRSAVLALRGGRDFQWGPVSTGPVLGLLHQHVQLRGFSESGSSGTTALSFGSQSRKAFVGQLGWRASVKAGHWQPFAQAAWERDLSPENRYVSASLRSVAAAPYVAAAAPVATDWATASAGTSCSINSRVHLRISARALLGTGWVTRYGGEGSLSVGF